MKAIKIDVVKKSLYEIEIKDWHDIAPAIGNECTLFACPVSFDNDDSIYVDDEGLHRELEGGFAMLNWQYPLVGNGIILGTDEEGDMVDYKSNIDELNRMIVFISKEEGEKWRMRCLA